MRSRRVIRYAGLGLPDFDPRVKELNSLTQTVFYLSDFMRTQQYRGEDDFAKQMINQSVIGFGYILQSRALS